jgi:hypothetical protein
MDAALAMGKSELDESTLMYIVAGVATSFERRLEEMWPLPLDEFGRLMDRDQSKSQDAIPSNDKLGLQKKTTERSRRGPKGRSPQQIASDIKLYEDYCVSQLTKEEFIRKRFRAAEFEEMMTRLETGRKDYAERAKT